MIKNIQVVYSHPSVDNMDFAEKIMGKLRVSPIHVSALLRRIRNSMSVVGSLEYHRKMTNYELEAIIIAELEGDQYARLENDHFTITPCPSPAELPQEAVVIEVGDDLDTATT